MLESKASIVFLSFLFFKVLLQIYLNLRNKNYVLNHSSSVPEKFHHKISLEEHQKAANYTVTKSQFGLFSLILDTAILLAWTWGGGLNFLDSWLQTYELPGYLTGTLLFAVYTLAMTAIGIPTSIYETFVIEEKFGFNKTTPKTFVTDIVKSLVLGALIALPLILGLLWIMEALGTYWWIYGWAFLTVIQLILIWAYPRFLAPLFNKFTELEDGATKDAIIALLKRIDFPYSGLFVMDASRRSSHGNAYFTGLGKTKRIVLFDTLCKNLTPEEIEAVLAHELGHFKKKHVQQMMIKSFIFSFIGFYILGFLIDKPYFYEAHFINTPSTYMALLLFTLVSSIYTFFIIPVSSFFSRKNEFEADEFAYKNSDANNLISALVKLYKDNASTLTPDPVYSKFYYSHPPALERIQFLESLMKEKGQKE